MNRTAWIVISVICILGLGSLIFFTKQDSVNVDSLDPSAIVSGSETVIGDRVYGKQDAKVIVFEYADFQCPGCAGAYPNMSAIQQLYSDKVAFVFRNFPLTTIHPNALAAATVAEAAGQQGKFWEMHDALFEQRSEWVDLNSDQRGGVFTGFANSLGLNSDTFSTDQAGKLVSEKINRDRALGTKIGVSSTPSLFIGASQADAETVNDLIQSKGSKLMDALDDALKAAGETPPSRS